MEQTKNRTMTMCEQLRKHLKEASQEQLDAEYESLKEYNNCGPTVGEYFSNVYQCMSRENTAMREGLGFAMRMRQAKREMSVCSDMSNCAFLEEEYRQAERDLYKWLDENTEIVSMYEEPRADRKRSNLPYGY